MTRHRLHLLLLFSLLLGGVAGAAGLWYFFGGATMSAPRAPIVLSVAEGG